MKLRVLSLLLCAVILLSSCSKTEAPATEQTKDEHLDTVVVDRTVKVYFGTVAFSTVKFFFINGNESIPYINQGIFTELLNGFFGDETYTLNNSETPKIVNTVNNSQMKINKEENQLIFDDYDLFFCTDKKANPLNASFVGRFGKLSKITSENYTPAGEKIIDLDDYKITTHQRKNNYYIPFATVCSIVPSLNDYVFNGSNIFCCNTEYPCYDVEYKLNEYGSFFKGNITLTFDSALREFTYNNLCLCIDLNYGLKAEKGFESADEFFERKGVKSAIFDGEPSVKKFEEQLDVILNNLLDDIGHTGMGITESGFFTEKIFDSCISTEEYAARGAEGVRLKTARGEVEQYALNNSETLVITLDEFSSVNTESTQNQNIIFTLNDKLNNDTEYANVKNIIIDLTCNQGGNTDGQLLLAAWITGEATENLMSVSTGATSEITAEVDINSDGAYDSSDSITDKNIYLLTSSFTFSAASVCASSLKGKENVTIIGMKTSGGSCNRTDFATVIGNSFRMSAEHRSLPVEYELGCEPDIEISSEEMPNIYNPELILSYKK